MGKAFQLKIAIKNSKPPIWRRVVVPTGITFSQFSMILNKVMGWSGYHSFQFEFYHLELRIIEGADEFDIGYGPCDYIEASDTYIREYMEENDWFTYIYDLGDDWKHRVTIERVIEDYEYDYPQVLKYRGDCPPEDCGGIDEYDMGVVNRELKEEFFYTWGKGEKRCQGGIYEEHFDGKYGLNATKRDKNKKTQVNVSGKHQLEQAMQRFKEAFDYKMQWEQKLALTSLADIFEDYEKADILEIAKDKGLEGVSKCSKKVLIERLVTHMLQEDVAKRYFLCLQDDEIEEFEKASKVQGLYESKEHGKLQVLYEAAYLGMTGDGKVIVPRDVVALYNSFKGKEFGTERKKISYLLCCLRTAIILYGIAPISVLIQLFDKNPEVHMTKDEIRSVIINIPQESKKYVFEKDMIYQADLWKDDGGLLHVQGGKEYYIPTLNEIIDFGTKGYDTKSKEARQLKQFMIRNMDATSVEADFACAVIQMSITGDCEMQDIFDIFDELGLYLKKENQINELIRCINELWNNTRMLLNRGFKPNELRAERQKFLQPLSTKNNVIDFSQVKKSKIYPNSPCPCGSGKKYKNCCKKNL